MLTYHCDGFLLGDSDGGLATAALAASASSGGTRASSRRSSKDSDGGGGGRSGEDSGCGLTSNLLVTTRSLYLLVLSEATGSKYGNIQK